MPLKEINQIIRILESFRLIATGVLLCILAGTVAENYILPENAPETHNFIVKIST